MNFSFYKNLSKKHLFLFLFFLSLAIGFSRCVPIEDLVPPTVGDFTLNEQYNISDTIRFQAILADNFGVSTYRIDIEPIDSTNTSLWRYSQTDSVKARLLDLEKTIIIPSNIAFVGDYKLVLTAFDVSGKSKIITKNFILGGDVSVPVFPDVILPNIIPIVDGNYVVCRNELVPLLGTVTDNVGLKRITSQFRFENDSLSTLVLRNISGVRVSLDGVFDIGLIFPDRPNNERFFLILTATDTEDNSRVIEIPFAINCDTENPIIESIDTNLDANRNENDFIEVIQGQDFFITTGNITDDQSLDKIFIYLHNIENNTTSLITEEQMNGVSFDLNTLNNIIIPIPPTATTGENSYEIRVETTDAVGNRSDIFVIKLDIRPNNPPKLTDVTLHDSNSIGNDIITVSDSSNLPLPVSSTFVFNLRGRISDDLSLDSYEIVWKKQGSNDVITRIGGSVTGLDVNFSPTENVEFEIPQNAIIRDIYILTISATDTFVSNPTVSINYYFIVE